MRKKLIIFLHMLILILAAFGCRNAFGAEAGYFYEVFPLERNGIPLHLDRTTEENNAPEKQILLIHGSSYLRCSAHPAGITTGI